MPCPLPLLDLAGVLSPSLHIREGGTPVNRRPVMIAFCPLELIAVRAGCRILVRHLP